MSANFRTKNKKYELSDKSKWFLSGALAYQLLQIAIVFLTGKAASEWAIGIHEFLHANDII